MKKPTYKRFLAYIIDFIIITLISALFSEIAILNPYSDKYMESANEFYNYIFDETNKLIISDNNMTIENNTILTNETNALTVDDISEQSTMYLYKISYYGFYVSLITFVIKMLYFVVFGFLNSGKTVGKALLKIRVAESSGKKLKITSLLIRSLIGYGLLIDLINLVIIRCLNMNDYLMFNNIFSNIQMVIYMAIVIMILFRKDNKGLHDLIAKTSVVYEREEKQ